MVALLRLSKLSATDGAAALVSQMVYSSDCRVPCFDGHSLHGATVEQVQGILSESPLTRDAELTLVDEGYQQVIQWLWPESIAQKLASESRIIDTLDYSNLIVFREGRVWAVYLTFAISLDDFLSTFGNPTAIYPAKYTRFGSEVFDFAYQDPIGDFEVWTLCEDPSLSADNDVRAYSYRVTTESDPTDHHHVYPAIPWDGYTDELPDCTVFHP